MKRVRKKLPARKTLPLVWRDSAWTLRVNIRHQSVCPPRRGTVPFTPFRGFHFSQTAN